MTTLHDIDADLHEPGHQSSATARVIEELQLYGYQPSAGEPDPRPLPDTGRSEAPSRTCSTSLPGLSKTPASNPTSPIFSGASPISSTKNPPAFSASSKTMKTARSARSKNRTAPKSARSNSRPSSPKAKATSSAVKLSSTSAISPRSAMRPRPARPGVPAPEASSTTST